MNLLVYVVDLQNTNFACVTTAVSFMNIDVFLCHIYNGKIALCY